jgi:two-component system, OmpR family, phosphate regulon response regulator PhoB
VSSRPLVLIADDNPDILLLLSLTLERDGYEVVVATNGLRAFEAALERVPHLIVLDLMMPGIDGLEVTRRLRAEVATREVPIVIVTAFAEETQAAKALAAGADLYLMKPFSPRDLLSKTASLVLERRPRSRLATG